MAHELTVRIYYPLRSGRIVLRSELDWNADVEPASVSGDGTCAEFRLEVSRPFLYFKPCIRDGADLHWSRGANYLAVTTAPGGKDVYPHFFSGEAGTITDVLTIPSTALGRDMYVRVYLPPGYQENALKRYPTLYMHDGQNLFFAREAFIGEEWQVDETLDLLDAMSAIDKAVVVGIYPHDRFNEYTQQGYDVYGRFLVDELMPALASGFRLLGERESTAVMGSSLGGVVSFYLAWQYPDRFGKAACLSSTFTYRDDLMERVAREEKRNVKLYLDSGYPGDNYEVTRSMRDLLLARGYTAGSDLLYFAFPGALHNEKAWAMRCHIPFQFFYGKVPSMPR